MSRTSVSPRRTRRLPFALFLGAASLTALTAASAASGLFGLRAQAFASHAWIQAEDEFAELRQDTRDHVLRFWTRASANTRLARRARERAATGTPTSTSTANPVVLTPVAPTVDSTPVLSSGGRISSNSSRPRLVNLPMPVPAVDKSSAAYTRFKGWVDAAVAG
ncbi:MAG TPA: hypothetical protein VJ766_12900, partial [Pseudoxanthomonas sp.]|nr:hypothetical protein [Pseudoxanthomonas sp.]